MPKKQRVTKGDLGQGQKNNEVAKQASMPTQGPEKVWSGRIILLIGLPFLFVGLFLAMTTFMEPKSKWSGSAKKPVASSGQKSETKNATALAEKKLPEHKPPSIEPGNAIPVSHAAQRQNTVPGFASDQPIVQPKPNYQGPSGFGTSPPGMPPDGMSGTQHPVGQAVPKRQPRLSDGEINKAVQDHFSPPKLHTADEAISYDLPPAPVSTPWPCTHAESCPDTYMCDIPTGICEPRIWQKPPFVYGDPPESPHIANVKPLTVSPGDMIVVDGNSLYRNVDDKQLIWRSSGWTLISGSTLLTSMSIGGRELQPSEIINPDDNRLVLLVESDTKGKLKLRDEELGLEYEFSRPITVKKGPRLVRKCGEKNPPASGVPGEAPTELGPFGSGYVDVHKPDPYTRIYYPAKCGGMRMPPTEGSFQVVLILHGNGASHINYEYLGQFLATWGFITVVPNEINIPAIHKVLVTALNSPETFWPPLQGKSSGGEAFVIGHSRGGVRAESLIFGPGSSLVKGIVNLAPYRPYKTLPVPNMYFTASGDRQALPDNVYVQWMKQESPTYFIFIMGGNHSQFTDNRHWELYNDQDAIPYTTRKRQHMIIQAYTLAFFNSLMSGKQPFLNLLDGMDKPQEVLLESR